jgi:hypothetical protein
MFIKREEYLKLSPAEKRRVHYQMDKELKEYCKGNPEITEALKIVKPSLFGINKKGSKLLIPRYKQFADYFVCVGDRITEQIFFDKMKIGRLEGNIFIRDIIKKFVPEDIKWIKLIPNENCYILEKIGKEPPENWKGYLPGKRCSYNEVDVL